MSFVNGFAKSAKKVWLVIDKNGTIHRYATRREAREEATDWNRLVPDEGPHIVRRAYALELEPLSLGNGKTMRSFKYTLIGRSR